MKTTKVIEKLKKIKKFPYFTSHKPELEYFLGYTGSNGYLLFLSQKEFLFFTDGRYFEAYKKQFLENIKKIEGGVKIYEAIAKVLKEKNFSRLYINPHNMSYAQVLELRKFLKPLSLRRDDKSVANIRKIKSYKEVEKIKKSIAIADEGLSYLIAWLKEGITEKQAATELEYYLKLKGAEELAFNSIVLFGENTAYPHGESGNRALKEGDVVLVDLGVKKDLYCSDMTRTFCFKKASVEFKNHYHLLLDLQNQILDKININMNASELDLFLREELKKANLLDYYTHSLGHGVGVEVHELPTLSYLKEKEILKKGMIFTIEPGIYLPNQYGIRIEDMVYMNGKGEKEILTDFPKNLLIKS